MLPSSNYAGNDRRGVSLAESNLTKLAEQIHGPWNCTYTYQGRDKTITAKIEALVKKETHQPGINISFKVNNKDVLSETNPYVRLITTSTMMRLQIMDIHIRKTHRRKGYGTVLFAILWGPLASCSYKMLVVENPTAAGKVWYRDRLGMMCLPSAMHSLATTIATGRPGAIADVRVTKIFLRTTRKNRNAGQTEQGPPYDEEIDFQNHFNASSVQDMDLQNMLAEPASEDSTDIDLQNLLAEPASAVDANTRRKKPANSVTTQRELASVAEKLSFDTRDESEKDDDEQKSQSDDDSGLDSNEFQMVQDALNKAPSLSRNERDNRCEPTIEYNERQHLNKGKALLARMEKALFEKLETSEVKGRWLCAVSNAKTLQPDTIAYVTNMSQAQVNMALWASSRLQRARGIARYYPKSHMVDENMKKVKVSRPTRGTGYKLNASSLGPFPKHSAHFLSFGFECPSECVANQLKLMTSNPAVMSRDYAQNGRRSSKCGAGTTHKRKHPPLKPGKKSKVPKQIAPPAAALPESPGRGETAFEQYLTEPGTGLDIRNFALRKVQQCQRLADSMAQITRSAVNSALDPVQTFQAGVAVGRELERQKRNNRLTSGGRVVRAKQKNILEATPQTLANRVDGVLNIFLEMSDEIKEEPIALAIAMATRLMRQQGDKNKAQELIDHILGIDLDLHKTMPMIVAAAMRSRLMWSTRQYKIVRTVLQNVFHVKSPMPPYEALVKFEHSCLPQQQPSTTDMLNDALSERTIPEMPGYMSRSKRGNILIDTLPLRKLGRFDLPPVVGAYSEPKSCCVWHLKNVSHICDKNFPSGLDFSNYTVAAKCANSFDGLGGVDRRQISIGSLSKRIRFTSKLVTIVATPNARTSGICTLCGDLGLLGKICDECRCVCLYRNPKPNSTMGTLPVMVCGGNEDDPMTREIVLRPLLKMFEKCTTEQFDLILRDSGVTLPVTFEFWDSAVDMKLMCHTCGLNSFSDSHICQCGASQTTAKDPNRLGTWKVMHTETRMMLAEHFEQVISGTKRLNDRGSDFRSDSLTAREISALLDQCRGCITTNPMSRFKTPMEACHCSINCGAWTVQIFVRLLAEVHIWSRAQMTIQQRRELVEAEELFERFLEENFHYRDKMMTEGKLARIIHNKEHRHLFIGTSDSSNEGFFPAGSVRATVKRYLEFWDPIRVLIRRNYNNVDAWVGCKSRLCFPFARWLIEDDMIWIGWPWYFHSVVEHLEEFQTDLRGSLAAFSAEGPEAQNKEDRMLRTRKARPGKEGYEDVLIAGQLRAVSEINDAWSNYGKRYSRQWSAALKTKEKEDMEKKKTVARLKNSIKKK
jgi:hypothetical protein